MSTKNEEGNYTKLFTKVMNVPKKKMSHAEKIMFCYILSYVKNNQIFNLDNKFLAFVLGDSIQSITDYITRLEKMGLIDLTYDRKPQSEGGYYITERTITVINLNAWTDKTSETPDVILAPKKNSKKKKPAEISEALPSIPTNEIAGELEQKMVEVELIAKQIQPDSTDFNVNEYLTPTKLRYAKRFEKDGITEQVLYSSCKNDLDNFFYADNIMQIKPLAKDRSYEWENINGINLQYVGAGSRLTLFIRDKEDKRKEMFQVNNIDFNSYLESTHKDFGNLTIDNFYTLKQFEKQPLKMS